MQSNQFGFTTRHIEKTKMDLTREISQTICLYHNFDLKNLKTLDAQANIIQKLHTFKIYVDKITVFTNSKKQKELFLSTHSSGRTCFKTITRLKQQANQLINQLPYESAESDFFVECVKNELTKFPILASSMTEESKNSY